MGAFKNCLDKGILISHHYKTEQPQSLNFSQRMENYTPIGYLVPAEFGVHFLPCMKNVPKRTKMHLNEVNLTKKSNRKAMNRNRSNQKANPALKTKTGNK